MCVTHYRKVEKNFPPRIAPYHIFLVFNLACFALLIYSNTSSSSSVLLLTPKKEKQVTLQTKIDTVQGGRQGGREVWTHDSYDFNRYMLLTSDIEDGAAALNQDM